jgi:putative hydrolase of the HAD superfamily
MDGYWVKRGYGSAEHEDDVQYAPDMETAQHIAEEMQRHGIPDVDIRAHIKGDLLKFYAVKDTDFFRCYYPTADGDWKFGNERHNGKPHYYPYDAKALKAMAERAADLCQLQVYGGDCIIRPDGTPVLIDLNDWPSFSRCREEAAKAIADSICHILDNTPSNNISTQAYIFDYGGTLDTGGNHWGRVLWQAWQRAGVPVTEEVFREAYVYGERTLEARQMISPDDTFRQTLDTKLRLELEYAGCDSYRQKILEDVYEQTRQHTAHSLSVLKKLAERCPIVLVSNFYGNLNTVLREFGMDDIFQHVIESAAVGIRKPDTRLLMKGIEALGLPPKDVAVVGDSIKNDILPALETGCRTIWLRGEQWDNTPSGIAIAHRTINDIEELLTDI